jgi:hypothetical protein
MGKFTGALASFKLDSVEYFCLQTYNWSGSIQEAVSRCSGASGAATYRDAGAEEDTFTFDIPLEEGATGVTIISALKRGSSGAFEFHPEDEQTGFLEFSAANALVTQSSLAGGVDEHGVLSITIGIDGILAIQGVSA